MAWNSLADNLCNLLHSCAAAVFLGLVSALYVLLDISAIDIMLHDNCITQIYY